MVFVYKKLAQLAVRCALPPRRSVTRFTQPTINPLACCICWAGLSGRAVFPPWNEGPNFGSYSGTTILFAVLKNFFAINGTSDSIKQGLAILLDISHYYSIDCLTISLSLSTGVSSSIFRALRSLFSISLYQLSFFDLVLP